jgi:pseudomonalisin
MRGNCDIKSISRQGEKACVMVYKTSQAMSVRGSGFVGAAFSIVLAGAAGATEPAARVTFPGNVHPLARPELAIGPTDPNLAMHRILLILGRRPGADEELHALLDDQQDPASERYHRWLTPDEFGSRFGITDPGLATVVGWLESQGFAMGEIARGRGWLEFNGTTSQVSKAFATPIRDYRVEGRTHHANAADPSVPRQLAGLVQGIVSLHDFPRLPLHHPAVPIVAPAAEVAGKHYLAPADFATIYDVNPLLRAGTDGSGVAIAIVGRSDINLADVQYFRSYFGLPAKDPVVIHNGPPPGDLGGGEEIEADLDVQWSGAVAPRATIDFVVSASTYPTDGVDLSAAYIVDRAVAPILSVSFGSCEAEQSASTLGFDNSLWAQAAAEGITVFIASGDSGASLCASRPTVSNFCATPYDVCVGGSQLADDPAEKYWAATPNPTTRGSALSYIPETAWNEPSSGASGGGASGVYPKPVWQAAPGVPQDGRRDVPDVALTSAVHDGYLAFIGHTASAMGLYVIGGTSAAAPSFAGLMALIVQQQGAQGNVNPTLYQLARNQYGNAGAVVFHDVTAGNNSFGGVAGFTAGPGYDLVTGLGSVDAAALAGHWNAAPSPDFWLAMTPSEYSLTPGAAVAFRVDVKSIDGFQSPVTLSVSGLPPGVSAVLDPPTLSGTGSSSLVITTAKSAATGFVQLSLVGTAGAQTHSVPISLRVLFFTVEVPSLAPVGSYFPLQLATGPDGAVWFTAVPLAAGGDRIGRVTTAGEVTEFSIPGCNDSSQCFLQGIAGAPDGAVWFTDVSTQNKSIDRITTAGAVTRFALPDADRGNFLPSMTLGQDGALWVLEYGFAPKVGRITTSGAITEFQLAADDQPPPYFSVEPSITAGPDGALWYTETGTNRIGRVTMAGKVTEFPVPTPRAGLTKIVAGPDGALWFAEASALKIGRITTTGAITELPTGFPFFEGYGISGLAVGPDGNLWFTARDAIGRGPYQSLLGRLSVGGTFTWFSFWDVTDLLAGPDGKLWFIGGSIGRVAVPAQAAPPCPASDSTLCIDGQPQDRRYQVEVRYETAGGLSGSGHAVSLSPVGIHHGGAFWFFSADNPEMLVKVIPGCAVNGHVWVFAAAGTDVGLVITVTDTSTGFARTYVNHSGTAAFPIQDTSAFACTGSATHAALDRQGGEAALDGEPTLPAPAAERRPAPAPAPASSCVASDGVLCLDGLPGDRRFEVQVSYRTAQGSGSSGNGHAIPLAPVGIVHGGVFWFFSADNPEMLVKVVDGCSVNGKQWFFASAATNVGLTVTVTDTRTGKQQVYVNPDGTAALPIQDTSAFSTCP